MSKVLRLGVVVVLGALALTGCGVNGPLEPPGGVAAVPGKAISKGAPEHRPFILDGIL